jgi:hypothetical protein
MGCSMNRTMVLVAWILFTLSLANCAKTSFNEDASKASPERTDGWVSSGGELFEDSQNPWWLQNTPEVRFCVKVDKEAISATEDMIQLGFERAIGYWQSEFEELRRVAQVLNQSPLHVEIATQKFTRVGCDENPDLRILAGFGSLSPTEAKFIGDTGRIIATSVRTNYDKVTLKGKGFVFLGSDLGKYKIRQAASAKPWRKPTLVKYAFVHELGHIFGIPHVGDGGLMAEGFLDETFSKNWMDAAPLPIERMDNDGTHAIPFLTPYESIQIMCGLSENFDKSLCEKYFELLPEHSAGLNFLWTPGEMEIKVTSLGGIIRAGTPLPVADAPVGNIKITKLGVETAELVKVHLPAEQTVFPWPDKEHPVLEYLAGPSRFIPIGSGEFTGVSGVKKSIYFEFCRREHRLWDLYSHRLFGVVDGVIRELGWELARPIRKSDNKE